MALPEERLFSTTEVATFLGVHPDSLRRAERAGRIPRARREPVSRHRVYSRADVELLSALIGTPRGSWPP
jgi:DNA-binding transcriptional MerR regulator